MVTFLVAFLILTAMSMMVMPGRAWDWAAVARSSD